MTLAAVVVVVVAAAREVFAHLPITLKVFFKQRLEGGRTFAKGLNA